MKTRERVPKIGIRPQVNYPFTTKLENNLGHRLGMFQKFLLENS